MKVPFHWLQEFIDLPETPGEIGERLTLAGLECAGVHGAFEDLDDVVVGEVLAVTPHPDADKLTVCRVSSGGEDRQVVCGAPNVRAGMKAPLVLPGGTLPDGTKIRRARLRGMESSGMLCSARELGLGDDHEGLLDLDAELAAGTALGDALGGNEAILELEITPNRGDALSILGVARDLSALLDRDLRVPDADSVKATRDESFPIRLDAPEACPVFAGRVIRGIAPDARSPLWLRERLRRAGVRPLHPVVDVTQYVMLELGQPMHAYDLGRLKGGICARWARRGERVALLDGSQPELAGDMLVIADEEGAVGLAGIMGGSESSVGNGTRDVFLESAFFLPGAIQGRGRRLGLQTDASYRFERGVDYALQERALERATGLIVQIAGGQAAPPQCVRDTDHLPPSAAVSLRAPKLEGLLGCPVPSASATRILERLELKPVHRNGTWNVTVPPHRFDIAIEEDLVEEVGRIYGYRHIPAVAYPAARPMIAVPEGRVPTGRFKQVLIQHGYQEVITYSFVDESWQRRFAGESAIALANPVSTDMSHMRTSLWPGLIQALKYNINRQRERVRIFECGLRFYTQGTKIKQEMTISALTTGALVPEQWGVPPRTADFFDVKGDVGALAALGRAGALEAEPDVHPALHPGRCARLTLAGEPLGWLGAIHPELADELEIPGDTVLFELALEPLASGRVPQLAPVSRFPAVRRDVAVALEEGISAARVTTAVKAAAGETLRELRIFDLYRGGALETGTKSLAIGLIFQHNSRTLQDEEVDKIVARVIRHLEEEMGARLRE